MRKWRSIQVTVPASTANLGPGFDAVGMALQLYLRVTVRESQTTEIQCVGDNLLGISCQKDNLIYRVIADLYVRQGKVPPEVKMTIISDIPLTRGLGSSAAAIVAGMIAGNLLLDEPYNRDEIFALAAEWEGHPDNVGACLFGGVVVATLGTRQDTVEKEIPSVPYVQFQLPKQVETVVVVPRQELSTKTSRGALPEQYDRATVVFSIGRATLLAASLATGRLDLLAVAMKDKIHQPYRAPFIKGFTEIVEEATQHGAIGAALSGAGPSMICLVAGDEEKARLKTYLSDAMINHHIQADLLELSLDNKGTVWEWID